MDSKFTNLRNRLIVVISIIIVTGLGLYYSVSNLDFEENFTSIIPQDRTNGYLIDILDSAAFFDKMIVHVHIHDSLQPEPSILVKVAQQLSDSINVKFIPRYILSIEGKMQPGLHNKLFNTFSEYLPLYMEDDNYKRIDSLILSKNLSPLVVEQLKILNSPAGFAAAKYIFQDPIGLVSPQLKRLKTLQIEENITVYNNYLLSKDKRHLLLFLTPKDVSNTGENVKFIASFDKLISSIKDEYRLPVNIEYSGALPISVANSIQIKKDIRLTLTVAVIGIVLMIFYFYRRWRYLWLILLPAIIGATAALTFFAFYYHKVSVISLGIGSVLLGITVDYALHIFTHIKHQSDTRSIIKDVALPLIMSSLTTAVAFLCLLFLSSPAIRQLGLYAGISVIVAALVSIFVLPLIIKNNRFSPKFQQVTFIEKIARFSFGNPYIIFIIILIVTVFFSFFVKRVTFEEDLESVNFMTESLVQAEVNLKKSGGLTTRKSFLLCTGDDINHAILNNCKSTRILDSLKTSGVIKQYNSVSEIIFNEEYQKEKIQKWNSFWSSEKIKTFKELLNNAAIKNGIKPEAYKQFYSVIEKEYKPVHPHSFFSSFGEITSDFKIETNNREYIASVIHLNDSARSIIAELFTPIENCHFVDKKTFFNSVFDKLKIDFDKLISVSLVLVFLIILIFFGRIELAIVTFTPILISWIWTLGTIGLLDIRLNFFNIVVCSLVFGLGVDYSIFVTNGLISKYKTGENVLTSFKSSVLISAITTITGLGVLLLAKHPALKSIAGLAIVGIMSSVINSFSIQPLLFGFLVGFKNKRRYPVTLLSLFMFVLCFGMYGIISVLLMSLLPLMMILPVKKHKKQYLVRLAVTIMCRMIIILNFSVRYRKVNFEKLNLNNPSIIISNHQSMIDILLFLSFSPKLIILTKDWVWNNLIFGAIVRYSGHINVSQGHEEFQSTIKKRIAEGCSILVFPEGSRTTNGKIKRFHKGGFFLAEQLSLPVHKILIHGIYDVMPKGAAALEQGKVIIKYLSTYKFDDPKENIYSKVAKQICAEMRVEFKLMKNEYESVQYNKNRIIKNFIYKSPILEHYTRIKIRLENNYEVFDKLVPEYGKIYDIGCGYGMMAFMLKLRSPERNITAIDYDEKKIVTALNCQLNEEAKIDFHIADAMKFAISNANAIVISDMLHYLKPDEQEVLIENCVNNLLPGGSLIIRDGDSSMNNRHKGTIRSEFFSTRLGFNKFRNKLYFFSRNLIEQQAKKHQLSLKFFDYTRNTSNLVYILSKR